MPSRYAEPQELRDRRPLPPVRGQAARARGECGPPPRRARALPNRQVAFLRGASAGPKPRRGLPYSASAHGILHGVQHADLPGVHEIRLAGGHHSILNRRGVHGCDALPQNLRPDAARAGDEDDPRRAKYDRHYGDGRHRYEPVPLQDRDGHSRQAHTCR